MSVTQATSLMEWRGMPLMVVPAPVLICLMVQGMRVCWSVGVFSFLADLLPLLAAGFADIMASEPKLSEENSWPPINQC